MVQFREIKKRFLAADLLGGRPEAKKIEGALLMLCCPGQNVVLKEITSFDMGRLYIESEGIRQHLQLSKNDVVYDLNRTALDNERKWYVQSFLKQVVKDGSARDAILISFNKGRQVLLLELADESRLKTRLHGA